MKVLIQQVATGYYLTASDEWSSDAEGARDFGTSSAAVEYVVQKRILGVQILLRFNGSDDLDVRLPLQQLQLPEEQPGEDHLGT